MRAEVSIDKLRGFFAASPGRAHSRKIIGEQTPLAKLRELFSHDGSSASRSALTREKVQTFIFDRNSLQNHKNCGFAATGSFENS
jgi:hypothetical protein